MRTRIIQIGNSRGIRIPKAFLEELSLTGEVELEIQDDRLVLKAIRPPRQGWDEAFQRMAQEGDDRLVDWQPLRSEWDETEWEW